MRVPLPLPALIRARLPRPAELSIRWQMTLLYTALLGLLLAVFSLFLVRAADGLMITSVTQTLHARYAQAVSAEPQIIVALALGTAGSPTLAGASEPRALAILERLAGPDLFVQVRDRAGHVVAASTNLHGVVLPRPRHALQGRAPGSDDIIRLPVRALVPGAASSDLRRARFALRSGLLLDAQGRTVGMLQVAQALLAVDEVQEHLVAVLVRGVLVALAVAVAAGLWLAGRLVRPLAQMTTAAQQIGRGSDLSRRIAAPRRHDEIGQLAMTFNAMLARLERAFQGQQRFVADAGHELKTPLTAILGQAHLIRRRGHDHPEVVAEAATAIIEETERLARLAQELLDLARLDEGQPLAHEVVSLGAVVTDVVAELRPLAGERAVHVTVGGPVAGSTLVRGDPDKLRQLVRNLVQNALKFTPAGGQVHVRTSPAGPRPHPVVLLEVQDSGWGIAPDDLPHLFERFYRADHARSRDAGGTGLGLAIVQEIVRRHGGTVEVESAPGHGALFRVRLPAFTDAAEP